MQSPVVATIVKMIETLPEAAQNQVADHLREYIAQLQDEAQWDDLFVSSQAKLTEAARRAKQQIAEGQSTPMDYDVL